MSIAHLLRWETGAFILMLIGVALFGTALVAFILAVNPHFQPERRGFFARLWIFAWRYAYPAGLIWAALTCLRCLLIQIP